MNHEHFYCFATPCEDRFRLCVSGFHPFCLWTSGLTYLPLLVLSEANPVPTGSPVRFAHLCLTVKYTSLTMFESSVPLLHT